MIELLFARTLLECLFDYGNSNGSRSTLYLGSVILAIFLAMTDSGFAQVASESPKPSVNAAKYPGSQPTVGAIHPALVQVEEDPKLPRVLLIGDSITMGYTQSLRELLKTKANVQHPTENCRSSRRIVEQLDQYLGEKPWDVIQLNCGIHDLTYLNEAGKVASPAEGGKVQVPLDEYGSNLEKIVERLKKTGAKLIWCTITPLNKPPAFRLTDDVGRYNNVAQDVMKKHGIQINDLNRHVLKLETPMWANDGVHFSPDGYRELTKFAAPVIETSLPQPKQ